MIRYLRLFAYFVQFSFGRAFEFRLDFCFRIIMDCVYYAISFLFFRVLLGHTDLIGGWTLEQLDVFVGGYIFLDALQMTLFSNNIWWLPRFINKGDLDYYLVRPVSSLFFLSLRDFAANSFVNLVIATAIFVWTLLKYSQPITFSGLSLYVFLLLNGTFLHYILHMMCVIPAFWTQSAEGLQELYFQVHELSERPDPIYTGWFRIFLLTILPLALMSSLPARLFFEGFQWSFFLNTILVSTVFFLTLLLFWHNAIRNYSSASS